MLDSIWVWIVFNIILVGLLFLDLVVLMRKDHVVGMKEAAWLTVFWTIVGVAPCIYIFLQGESGDGVTYLTAYVAERALSLDNLFVFLIIFGYFQVPAQYQPRGLLWGIVMALIARAVFIAAGVAIINAFSWVLFILGAFLVYTAYKLAFSGDHEVDPGQNVALRMFRKIMPVSSEYDGHRFFTRIGGVRMATPMLLLVIVLGTTDIVFAVDSIPTVFGITTQAFLVWSSNAMAVLGMRPLFFLLAGMVKIFRYLQYGLAIILGFIGVKMIVEEAFHDFHLISEDGDIFVSLGVILAVLVGSIALSMLLPERKPAVEHADGA